MSWKMVRTTWQWAGSFRGLTPRILHIAAHRWPNRRSFAEQTATCRETPNPKMLNGIAHCGCTVAAGGVWLALVAGCSRVPAAPDQPDWTPKKSAAAAVAQYDSDRDGQISAQEVVKAPGLKAAFARVDANKDGQLSEEEIAARIGYYPTANTTIANGTTKVTLDGRPLVGATVMFEPEDFLGPAFKTCRGETNQSGTAVLSGPDAKFPGIYLGMYRVKISKMGNGRETLPAHYNSATQLGYEVADDTGNVGGIAFDLKSH